MTMSRWSYVCVLGVLLACANAQTSDNQTETIVPSGNSSDVTTPVPVSTASMDSSSTSSPSSMNSTTPIPPATNETSSNDASDANLTTSGNWMPGKFPPPGMTSAADSGNADTTTPSTTPLTVVEVGNVPTAQNDEKQKYDVNNWNNAMPNDAPAESQPSTKESVMGSTVSYSKEGASAQQKPSKGAADTRQAHFGLLAASFLLALVCNSRM